MTMYQKWNEKFLYNTIKQAQYNFNFRKHKQSVAVLQKNYLHYKELLNNYCKNVFILLRGLHSGGGWYTPCSPAILQIFHRPHVAERRVSVGVKLGVGLLFRLQVIQQVPLVLVIPRFFPLLLFVQLFAPRQKLVITVDVFHRLRGEGLA